MSIDANDKQMANIYPDPDQPGTYLCSGNWDIHHIAMLEASLFGGFPFSSNVQVIKVGQIKLFDSAGALILNRLQNGFEKASGHPVKIQGLSPDRSALLSLVANRKQIEKKQTISQWTKPLQVIGKQSILHLQSALIFIAFIGEVFYFFYLAIKRRVGLPWKSFLQTIELTGYNALPIVGLLSFLVGLVLSYQIGMQLNTYGAGIFTVDLLGLGILREFGPLIAAIIVAGRSGSAFTAELGSMNINQEIDALKTFGVSPTEYLVFPRLMGMLVSFPLLAIWSDIFGVLGGMIMLKYMMHIGFAEFLIRFQEKVALKTLILGLIKTPIFAFVIASVGCFRGFQVQSDSTSVGKQTTMSVVQSIFLIIIIDAIFSIVFSLQGL